MKAFICVIASLIAMRSCIAYTEAELNFLYGNNVGRTPLDDMMEEASKPVSMSMQEYRAIQATNQIPILADVIASNAVQILPNATLCHFGVLTSSVHMAWMRTVAGRLEMRYRYSKELVYNTFPWPDLRVSAPPRERIEKAAQHILDVRAKYPDCSFAELYDENLMPPDLRAAHVANDRAVLAVYGLAPDTPDPEIVAHLFKLYAGKNQMKQENRPCT